MSALPWNDQRTGALCDVSPEIITKDVERFLTKAIAHTLFLFDGTRAKATVN